MHVIRLLVTEILLNAIYGSLKHILSATFKFADIEVIKNAKKSWFYI